MTALALLLTVVAVSAFVGIDGVARGTALHAALGMDGRPRGAMLAGTGPQLLLGHIWMVVTAGLLVGLFPRWESAVVEHACGWVIAIVAGLVLRVAAIGVAALGIPAAWARAGQVQRRRSARIDVTEVPVPARPARYTEPGARKENRRRGARARFHRDGGELPGASRLVPSIAGNHDARSAHT